MNTITGLLEGFEKIAYKFLLSIIFIPKTIFRIIVNPGWVPDYVEGELNPQKESPFDEYLSPIVLLLVVALFPAVIYASLPPLGVTITNGPAEKSVVDQMIEQTMADMLEADPSLADALKADPSLTGPLLWEPLESLITNRFFLFEAATTSISGPTDMEYIHSWFVEKIFLDEQGKFDHLEEIYRVNYDSKEFPVERINNNTAKDTFYYLFDVPGNYYINVEVEKFYKDNRIPVEIYSSYSYVYVPDQPEKPVFIDSGSNSSSGGKTDKIPFSERLKKESNIFLALGLLTPPLLFALATKLFTKNRENNENSSKESFYEISQNSLRTSFYSQCYYFSPIGLAIWAAVFSSYYLTPDIFFYKDIGIGYAVIFLPLLLAISWFIGVETVAIARERGIPGWIAFLITLLSIAILIALASLVIVFSDIQDNLRITSIWLYLFASGVLLAVVAIVWVKRKKTENSKIKLGEVVLVSALLLVLVLVATAFAGSEKIPPSAPKPEIDLRSGSIESFFPAVVSAATELPTEAPPTDIPLPETQPFYTEEFDNPLSSDWSIFTMTDSDQAHADKVTVEAQDGKLVWNFDSVYVYYYLFNGAFRYEDVRVDVRADNRGRNNNNISLICRYNPDVGWYEFNIANNGLYDIYFAEVVSNGKIVYNSITNGGSNSIKIGKAVNEYSITCKGEQLTLFINGDEVNSVAEKNYGLREGQVGVSVSSFDVLPILIEMDWIKISEP